MRIMLLLNVPVHSDKGPLGMTARRVLNVLRPYKTNGGEHGVVVIGDTGEKVRIHNNEYLVVNKEGT